jgi:hypothetical protein
MKHIACAVLLSSLVACASSGEPTVVPKPHVKVAKASILPGKDLPAERDGIPIDNTGAIMWVCSNSEKHEDKEVFINKCPACGEMNYFYWNTANAEFICFACTKPVDNGVIKCPEDGQSPRKVRTKPQAK